MFIDDGRDVKGHIADKRALNFFKETGQHALLVGATGSGKTTLLYWLIKRLVDDIRNECIIHRDTGKGGESIYLTNFKPVRYFVPPSCAIEVQNDSIDLEVVEFNSFNELFQNITRDKINIVSVCRYLRDPYQWSEFWALFFEELVDRALGYELPTPLTTVVDELNQICPSERHAIHSGQRKTSAFVARMVESLRGVDVRLLGTSQGWTKCFKAVRNCFQYYFFKRVAERVDIDIPALKTTLNTIQSLRVDQYIVLVPEKYYTNPYSKLPDLGIKKFTEKHRLIYKGKLPYDWQCESELRPKDENKKKEKERLDIIKKLTKLIYENEIVTQKELGEAVGKSQQTISRWINDDD